MTGGSCDYVHCHSQIPKARYAQDLVSKFHAAEDQCEGTQLLSMLSWVQSKATENSTPVSWTLLQCEAQGLEAVPYPIPKVYQKKLPAK